MRPYPLELAGLFVTIAAISLMLADPDAKKSDETEGELYVYVICLGCAYGGALWMMVNSKLVKSIPLFLNLFCQAVI